MRWKLPMPAVLCLPLLGVMPPGCAAPGDSCRNAPTAAARDDVPRSVTVLADDLSPLREAFNARSDRWRVVALVSPTCSECLLGAEAVKREITDRYDADRVATLIVWIPMLPTDDEQAARASATLFPADRGAQFYDGHQSLGAAYTRQTFAGFMDRARRSIPAGDPLADALANRGEVDRPQWDLYMLYAPGVRWEAGAGRADPGPPMPTHWLRHLGRRDGKTSTYWHDSPDSPPRRGDLFEAMRAMMDEAQARG